MRPRWSCPYCGQKVEPDHRDVTDIRSAQSATSDRGFAHVTITYLIRHNCKEITA